MSLAVAGPSTEPVLPHVRLLVAGAPPDAARRWRGALARSFRVEVTQIAGSGADACDALATERHDAVLVGTAIGSWSDALRFLDDLQRRGRDEPCLFMCGTYDHDEAVEAMRRGAADVLAPDHLQRLPAAIARALRERAMRARLDTVSDAVESASDALVVIEPGGASAADAVIVYANRATEAFTTAPHEVLVGAPLRTLDPFRLGAEHFGDVDAAVALRRAHRFEKTYVRTDGAAAWVELGIEPALHSGARVTLTLRDITARKRADDASEAVKTRLRAIMEQLPAVIWTTGLDLRVRSIQGLEHLDDAAHEADFVGASVAVDHVFRDEDRAIAAYAHRQALLGSSARFEVIWSGRLREAHVEPLREKDGTIVGTIGVALDVTERRQTEDRLAHVATHDVLTDLPNRRLFGDRLAQALLAAQRLDRKVALLFIDIDRFKNVNDLLGHSIGDHVIKAVAQRLERMIASGDTLARFAGDTFVGILSALVDASEAEAAAERVVEALKAPFRIDGRELYLTVSVGVGVFPDDATEPQTLLSTSEAAMYDAKRFGRNAARRFTTAMHASPDERLTLAHDMREALARGEFFLKYQPMLDARTETVVGFEALVRWQHPKRGLVLPDLFIPLAEENGLVVPLGEWVVEETCRRIRAWKDAGASGVRIGVNVSARQLESHEFVPRLAKAIATYRIDPAELDIEVTESAIMRDVANAVRTLLALKHMGLCISVDDFGTGYTSLGFLKRFPIDVLKIDRSFVRDVTSGIYDSAVVRAVTTLARGLAVKTVAEGVETVAQFERLRELGCNEVQGYLFSEAVEPERAFAMLGERIGVA
jgi:diguanylate cyclase (GGDEF)-like protein/PAS domain S-box-containing protein